MNMSVKVIATALVLLAPVVSWAQSSSEPLTRAHVRAQLIQLEKAGYNPAARDNASYPADIQSAEARIAAQNMALTAKTSVGGVAGSNSGSGHSVSVTRQNALFRHH